jgi:mitochondrial fission protein ELM1
LRKELRNTGIELITDIVVQESEYKPYSETEKLAEMVRKNPNLALLKQRFNLDFGE